MRPELAQRAFSEFSAKNGPGERTVLAIGFTERSYCALYFLRLVARMLCVASPSRFNEGHGYADLIRRASPLKHKVQVMAVPESVSPRYLKSLTRGTRPLLIQ